MTPAALSSSPGAWLRKPLLHSPPRPVFVASSSVAPSRGPGQPVVRGALRLLLADALSASTRDAAARRAARQRRGGGGELKGRDGKGRPQRSGQCRRRTRKHREKKGPRVTMRFSGCERCFMVASLSQSPPVPREPIPFGFHRHFDSSFQFLHISS